MWNKGCVVSNKVIPDDYKDPIYRITYFILGKVAHLVPPSIHPNSITVAAFVSAMIGCLLLCVVQSPAAFLYWTLFNFIWFVLDALDGIHARLTGQASEFGGFLDHALDNIFFVFMFTAFTLRFDLVHPFFIFIVILRVTAAVMTFTVQYHTKRLYLDRVSGGAELLLFSSAMILSYCFSGFDPVAYVTNATLLSLMETLNMREGFFMKMTLLVYLIGVPITFVNQFKFVRRECAN